MPYMDDDAAWTASNDFSGNATMGAPTRVGGRRNKPRTGEVIADAGPDWIRAVGGLFGGGKPKPGHAPPPQQRAPAMDPMMMALVGVLAIALVVTAAKKK